MAQSRRTRAEGMNSAEERRHRRNRLIVLFIVGLFVLSGLAVLLTSIKAN